MSEAMVTKPDVEDTHWSNLNLSHMRESEASEKDLTRSARELKAVVLGFWGRRWG